MKFRRPYDKCPRYFTESSPDVNKSRHAGVETPVRREFKDICDINYICKKIAEDGIAPVPMTASTTPRSPMFGDFSEGGDFQDLQNRQLAADSYFQGLPDDVRSRFGSSAQFFDSLNDPNIMQYLVERGVFAAPAKPKKPAKSASVVTPEPAGAPAPAPQA